MVLLDKMWDEVIAGPSPSRGLGKLRKKISTKPLVIKDEGGESSGKLTVTAVTPATPATPTTPQSSRSPKPNVWRSVFHPGSNINTKTLGAELFDKPQPNSPTVYDWLYSGETKSSHR